MLSGKRITVFAPMILVLCAGVYLYADWSTGLPENYEFKYVGKQSCIECHQQEHEQWTGSDHDMAMKHADAKSVVGDFNNQTHEQYGVTSKMYQQGDKYFIETEDEDGELHPFEVKFTFGIYPLQQYLVETRQGRLQALNVAWNSIDDKWFTLNIEGEQIPHNDILHWTGAAGNWNHMCADCHSTDVHKKFEMKEMKYHTDFKEINVSCEACHGPGSGHIELAKSSSLFWDRTHGYGLAKLKDKNTDIQIETCAKCHSRRELMHESYIAGKPMMDHYVASLLDREAYHVDGQIHPGEETYVYGSFLQSKMYRKGVRCSDCHNPHSAKTKEQFPGNNLCGQCHKPALFDTPQHHHHAVNSKGARCVECHMPETTYMELDPRRDHSIRIPRPDLTVKLGTPNACNRCHDGVKKKEETPEWAAEKIVAWFGEKRKEGQHFGEVFALARARNPEAVKDLLKIYFDKKQDKYGPIVRASAIAYLGRLPNEDSIRTVTIAAGDEKSMIRHAAIESMIHFFEAGAVSPEKVIETVSPALTDEIRAVRIQALKVLSALPANTRTTIDPEVWKKVLAEFEENTKDNADQALAHFNLALVLENIGNTSRAEAEYLTSIKLNPLELNVRRQLAILYQSLQKTDAAEKLLTEGIDVLSDYVKVEDLKAQNHYLLGQVLRESGKLEQALVNYKKATELSPTNSDFLYNYGLLLQSAEQYEEAETQLIAATKISPKPTDYRSNEYLYALALLNVKQEKFESALKHFSELSKRQPNEPDFHYQSSQALQALDKLDEAAEELTKAFELAPDPRDERSNRYLFELAMLYVAQEKHEFAAQCFEELARRSPGISEFRYRYGLALMELKKFPAAEKELMAAISFSRDARVALYLSSLAHAYEAQEKYKEALQTVEDLIQREPSGVSMPQLLNYKQSLEAKLKK